MDITNHIPLYMNLKILHLLAAGIWLTSMMILPLIFHIHAKDTIHNNGLLATEKLLLKRFINPAMIITILIGVALVILTGAGKPGSGSWIHLKITLILFGLGLLHMRLAQCYKKACNQQPINQKPLIFQSLLTLFLGFLIYYLATLKPF
jgi:uncharacterized membrane protein